MAMRVFIEDSFDSAHWLPNVPVGHKCREIHGHTYKIRLEIGGEVGAETGWIVDYADLKYAWSIVKSELDHRCINDIIQNSTCENVVLWICARLKPAFPDLARIELRETERCGVVLDLP